MFVPLQFSFLVKFSTKQKKLTLMTQTWLAVGNEREMEQQR